MEEQPLVVLIGPTAVGKTQTSIDFAKKMNAEIISADSMQVYRYMDIGTAKITPAEMDGIPHHLIDVVMPDAELIVLENGGLDLIKVTDNGCGMTREDALLALERHATSKIMQLADLSHLNSLGFRGEALPSIAAVSKLEIVTRVPDAIEGTRITVHGGMIQKVEPAGCPVGTTITVADLFYNTPARRKFLKTPVTETGYICETVNKLALSYPSISFHLIHHGRQQLATAGKGDLQETVMQIFDKETARQLINVDYRQHGFAVSGFIGQPILNRANRNGQIFFVNGRYVKNHLLNNALEQAYHTLVMVKRYPFAILAINMPGDEVDVNVHPAKTEVRFRDEKTVYQILYTAIKQGLAKAELIPEAKIDKPQQDEWNSQIPKQKPVQTEFKFSDVEQQNAGERQQPALELKEEAPAYGLVNQPQETQLQHPGNESQQPVVQITTPVEAAEETVNPELAVLLPLGQIDRTYIIAQGQQAMYIIDQHAAHERVLYEQLMKKQTKVEIQELLFPVTLELSPSEAGTLSETSDQFAELGFCIEEFGTNTYLVRGVPAILQSGECQGLIRELLDYLQENYHLKAGTEIREGMLITMACKAAIKAGKQLLTDEMVRLLRQLAKADNPYTCPHGRPTIIKTTVYELEKKFKRIV